MQKLTARQQQILDLIRSHIDATGYPPTRAEIAATLGFKSANAAEEHLKALARKGVIQMVAGASRGIRLLQDDADKTANDDEGLPVVGRVAAGQPILAAQHIQDHCQLPPNFFKPQAHYLLEVRGDSMKDVGILDGDWLAVHKTQQVRNGQIVVARIDDEVTVKRFEQKGKQVLLHAENPDYQPIAVDLTAQAFEIEGISVGVIRRH